MPSYTANRQERVRVAAAPRPRAGVWFGAVVLTVLVLVYARPALGITAGEVTTFKAELQATPTDAGNVTARMATAEQIQNDLILGGADVSIYDFVFRARGLQEMRAGDLSAFHQTAHRYCLALVRHYETGAVDIGTPITGGTVHPHLFFTPAEAASLRTPATAEHQTLLDLNAYSVAQFAATSPDAYAAMDSVTGVDPWRTYGNNLVELSFRAMTTRSAGDIADAKRWLDAVVAYPHWGAGKDMDAGLPAAHLLVGTAIAYDWLYNDLTQAEREAVRRKLANHAAIVHAFSAGYQNAWWRDTWMQNHNPILNTAIALTGYALRGEVEEAEEWIARGRANVDSVLTALNRIGDGSYHEGIGYWSYMMTFLLLHLDAIEHNDGVDLISSSPWLRETILFRLYCQYPDYKSVVPFADTGYFDWHGPEHILRRLEATFRTGYGEWLVQQLLQAKTPGHYERRMWAAFEYLWYDSTVVAKAPDDLPLSRTFADLDLTILRSGWDTDATVVVLKSGRPEGRSRYADVEAEVAGAGSMNAGHDHPNQNALNLFAHGESFLTGPGYPDAKNTLHHNTVIIDQTGQVGEGGPVFDAAGVMAAGAYGRIERFYTMSNYDYVVGEAGAAYPASCGVQGFSRSVLFIKPGLVVVTDQVDLQSAKPVHWVWRRYGSEFLAQGSMMAVQATSGPTMWMDFLMPAGVQLNRGQQAAASGAPPFYYGIVNSLAGGAANRLVTVLTPRPDGSGAPSSTLDVNGADAVNVTVRDGDSVYDVGVSLAPNSAAAAGFGLVGDVAVAHLTRTGDVVDYFLANGTQWRDPGTGRDFVVASIAPVTVQVRLVGSTAYVDATATGGVSLYAPGVTNLQVNGAPAAFSRSGDMIMLQSVALDSGATIGGIEGGTPSAPAPIDPAPVPESGAPGDDDFRDEEQGTPVVVPDDPKTVGRSEIRGYSQRWDDRRRR